MERHPPLRQSVEISHSVDAHRLLGGLGAPTGALLTGGAQCRVEAEGHRIVALMEDEGTSGTSPSATSAGRALVRVNPCQPERGEGVGKGKNRGGAVVLSQGPDRSRSGLGPRKGGSFTLPVAALNRRSHGSIQPLSQGLLRRPAYESHAVCWPTQ